MQNKKFILFLSGLKGLLVLEKILIQAMPIAHIYIDIDLQIENDSSSDIRRLCEENHISSSFFKSVVDLGNYDSKKYVAIAIGWRKIIKGLSIPLIVIHDSILPRYRGFAPTVAQLINKEETLGVTAFLASTEYDCGDIIVSEDIDINYPMTIKEALELISECYVKCIENIKSLLKSNESLITYSQDKLGKPSYTIWRDEYDYFIDWSLPALKILRTIDALGHPYAGAQTMVGENRVILHSGKLYSDQIKFEEVHYGKVYKLINSLPVVICGDSNLIYISRMTNFNDNSGYMMKRLRSRLYKPSYEKYLSL